MLLDRILYHTDLFRSAFCLGNDLLPGRVRYRRHIIEFPDRQVEEKLFCEILFYSAAVRTSQEGCVVDRKNSRPSGKDQREIMDLPRDVINISFGFPKKEKVP